MAPCKTCAMVSLLTCTFISSGKLNQEADVKQDRLLKLLLVDARVCGHRC